MRIAARMAIWVAAALQVGGVAWAEGPEDGPAPGSGPGRGAEGRPFQKRALQKMRMMRLLELQSALDLDERTTLKLAEVFKRHDNERDKIFEAVRKEMEALRAIVREAKPDEAKLTQAIDKLVALRQKMPEIQTNQIADARKVLTPLQQGKFVLHMAKFEKHFRDMMHRSFMRRGPHGDRPHGVPGQRGRRPGVPRGSGPGDDQF